MDDHIPTELVDILIVLDEYQKNYHKAAFCSMIVIQLYDFQVILLFEKSNYDLVKVI